MYMDAMSGIPALVFCYTLMIFYFWLIQYRHFSCYLACVKGSWNGLTWTLTLKIIMYANWPEIWCSLQLYRNGREILWSDTLRYLGVYITAGHKFCCSLENAKKSFYRTFNSIFDKVGRIAYENVVIELLKAKRPPSLYYGLEVCPITD